MKKNVYISASTDPIKDKQSIIEYAKLMQGKVELLHCDIMDGKFVKQKTYDYEVVKSINEHSLIMLDVHLMVEKPNEVFEQYIAAGANILTVHYEAFDDKELLIDTIKEIRERNTLAGISIKPETPFKEIKNFLYNVDVVLVMSVEPGMSGQKFEPSVMPKIREIDKFRLENNLNFKIEVDGGVNDENAELLLNSGVDILVSGSFLYNAKNRDNAIALLKCEKIDKK